MSKLVVSIDVEPDLHSGEYLGVTQGLKIAEEIFQKHNIKPILFVTCDCIEKNPEIFQELMKKGWEISLHGYEHKRFDNLSQTEKQEQIEKSVNCFKKYLKISPKGFRAPQHSIDNQTLDLLEKYNFEYDSSSTPRNFLQLLFFPSKFKLWLKDFFSPVNSYKIRKNLVERPTAAFIFPFVSLPLRISYIFSKILYSFLRLTRKEVVFYCHSWDFIKLPESKTDKVFSHKKFIKNLDRLLGNK
jgi:peptidoglycan/xylan/chitin deacetylase (PgdA/CDA1 family)